MPTCRMCNGDVSFHDGAMEAKKPIYWYCRFDDIFKLQRTPDIQNLSFEIQPGNGRLGGVVLNNRIQAVFLRSRICPNFTNGSLLYVKVGFETGNDNSGGTEDDQVRFRINYGTKAEGGFDYYSIGFLVKSIKIGRAPLYTFHTVIFDLMDPLFIPELSIYFRIRFLDHRSDIGSVILNHAAVGYSSKFSELLSTGCLD